MTIRFRGGSKSPVTPGMRVFVTILNGWYLWTICTWNFVADIPGILDLQLGLLLLYTFDMYI